ncbi:MAG: redoxin family protein [Burkholderiaceae bacterium]
MNTPHSTGTHAPTTDTSGITPRRRWLWAGALGSLSLAAGASGWWLLRPRASELAPPWMDAPWQDAQGQAIDLSGWRKRVVLLNFWATWCPPCVEEMPELSELHQRHADRGFGVFGIGIDSPSKIAEFQAKTPVSYPLAVGGLGATELARAFGNQGGMLPFSVLIDRDGRIRERLHGRVKLPAIDQSVRALLT